MGVDVNQSRRHIKPLGINYLCLPGINIFRDQYNLVVMNGNIHDCANT